LKAHFPGAAFRCCPSGRGGSSSTGDMSCTPRACWRRKPRSTRFRYWRRACR